MSYQLAGLQGAGHLNDSINSSNTNCAFTSPMTTNAHENAAFETLRASLMSASVPIPESGRSKQPKISAPSFLGARKTKPNITNTSPCPVTDNHRDQLGLKSSFRNGLYQESSEGVRTMETELVENLSKAALSYLRLHPELALTFLKQKPDQMWQLLSRNPGILTDFVYKEYGVTLPAALSTQRAIKRSTCPGLSNRAGVTTSSRLASGRGVYQPSSSLGLLSGAISSSCVSNQEDDPQAYNRPPNPMVEDDLDETFSSPQLFHSFSETLTPNVSSSSSQVFGATFIGNSPYTERSSSYTEPKVRYHVSKKEWTPSKPPQGGPGLLWDSKEVDSCVTHMLNIRDENSIKGEKRFEEASRRMKLDNFFRTPISVKNYWGRYGRDLTGFDERKNKNAPLSTSKQGKEARIANAEKKKQKGLEPSVPKKRKATDTEGDSNSRKKQNHGFNSAFGQIPNDYPGENAPYSSQSHYGDSYPGAYGPYSSPVPYGNITRPSNHLASSSPPSQQQQQSKGQGYDPRPASRNLTTAPASMASTPTLQSQPAGREYDPRPASRNPSTAPPSMTPASPPPSQATGHGYDPRPAPRNPASAPLSTASPSGAPASTLPLQPGDGSVDPKHTDGSPSTGKPSETLDKSTPTEAQDSLHLSCGSQDSSQQTVANSPPTVSNAFDDYLNNLGQADSDSLFGDFSEDQLASALDQNESHSSGVSGYQPVPAIDQNYSDLFGISYQPSSESDQNTSNSSGVPGYVLASSLAQNDSDSSGWPGYQPASTLDQNNFESFDFNNSSFMNTLTDDDQWVQDALRSANGAGIL